MTIVRSFVMKQDCIEDSDLHDRIKSYCHQARNFFDDEADEFKIARHFQEWGTFSHAHVDKMLTTLRLVLRRIEARQPHKAFPERLKQRYLVNIASLIERLRPIEFDIRPELTPCDHDATYPFNGHTCCIECKTILD